MSIQPPWHGLHPWLGKNESQQDPLGSTFWQGSGRTKLDIARLGKLRTLTKLILTLHVH